MDRTLRNYPEQPLGNGFAKKRIGQSAEAGLARAVLGWSRAFCWLNWRLLFQTGRQQSRGAKDCENANHVANSINDPIWWLDKFAKIFAWTLWYVAAHQRESFQSIDRSQDILDDDLSVMRRVASDEIVNGLKVVCCLRRPTNSSHLRNLALISSCEIDSSDSDCSSPRSIFARK